jgi:hypothetical protein
MMSWYICWANGRNLATYLRISMYVFQESLPTISFPGVFRAITGDFPGDWFCFL